MILPAQLPISSKCKTLIAVSTVYTLVNIVTELFDQFEY